MKREARALGLAGWGAAVVMALGCNTIDPKECEALRGQAFEIRNKAHICKDDAECVPTTWPGCTWSVNTENRALIGALKEKFDQGKCVEPTAQCSETGDVYCKEGLCTFRVVASQATPGK